MQIRKGSENANLTTADLATLIGQDSISDMAVDIVKDTQGTPSNLYNGKIIKIDNLLNDLKCSEEILVFSKNPATDKYLSLPGFLFKFYPAELKISNFVKAKDNISVIISFTFDIEYSSQIANNQPVSVLVVNYNFYTKNNSTRPIKDSTLLFNIENYKEGNLIIPKTVNNSYKEFIQILNADKKQLYRLVTTQIRKAIESPDSVLSKLILETLGHGLTEIQAIEK